jgi:diguanylate cyclase (GGDEF)-like protein/PAS domain S-box-containing protein
MIKIIDTDEFSHFLRVKRNEIIEHWLDVSEVQNILHRHSLPFIDKNRRVFYEFCDCFISIVQWRMTVTDCQATMGFLQLLYNYHISAAELFTLIVRLKTSIEEAIFQDGNLSFSLQRDIESRMIEIVNEVASNFEVMNGEEDGRKSEYSNLLSEYKRAVDLSNIVSKTNPKGVITYVNDKFCEISGYTREEVIGRPHNIIRHPDMPREAFKELWDTIKTKKSWHGIIRNMRKDGGQYIVDTTVVPILDVDGDITEYIAIRHDITELEETKQQLRNINKAMKNKVDELYSMTSSLEEKASKDKLTGISNRDNFEELFLDEIKYARTHSKALSLMLFDIDNFKNINDTYGHQAGDNILSELANLVSNNIKTSDVFARWGGEEFVLLLPNSNIEGATALAKKLRDVIEQHQFNYSNRVTVSFGVAQLIAEDDRTTLFQKADDALYTAKRNGRNRVEKHIE